MTNRPALRSASIALLGAFASVFTSSPGQAALQPEAQIASAGAKMELVGNFSLAPERKCVSVDLGAGSRVPSGNRELLLFNLPIPNSVPAILDADKQGRVWFVMGGGGYAGIHHPRLSLVGNLTSRGRLQVFRLPTEEALPSGLKVAGSKIYITEYGAGQIAVVDLPSLQVREHPLPDPASRPTALDLDSAGNLWFNQNLGNKVGRLDAAGNIKELEIPTVRSRPTGMVVDDHDVIWFAQMSGNKIGRISPEGSLSELTVPTPNARPTAMTKTSDGRVWFTERAANKLAVIDGGKITEYEIPWPDTGPFFILDGQDGALWFTQLYSSAIGRFDLATKQFGRIMLPVREGWPAGLGFDSDGNLWVTFQLTNQVAVITREHQSC